MIDEITLKNKKTEKQNINLSTVFGIFLLLFFITSY